MDGVFQTARQRQRSMSRVRFAKAGHGAGRRERGGHEPAKGDLLLPAKALERCGRGGAAAAVEVRDLARGCVVDQPEGIATDAAHMGVNDPEGRSGGDAFWLIYD